MTREDVQNYRWYIKHKNGVTLSEVQKHTAKHIKTILNYKYWLNGEASKQYLDYAEYKAARKSSRKATFFAIISVFIAAGSFWFTYYVAKESPKPPYEVKVIEDNTRPQLLEKENNRLREELYKAERRLRVYESDSTKVGL